MEKYILKSKNQGSFSFVYSYGSYIKILMKVVCMKSFDIKNKVSIIIPVYNEEENIDIIVQKIVELPIKNKEILFIDDGSTDNTLEKIHNNSKSNTDIKYISLSRNFGHQIALKVGFDYCSGDCAITMDGDMQHPPEVIIEMLERWVYGAEVVHTRRLPEENQSIFKRVTSKYFYKFINFCSSVDIQPGTADFRLLDAKIVQICQQLQEDTFFWRGLIPWMGFKQDYIDYVPNHRLHGKSKYSLKKMVKLAWDGISSFSLLPLRIATVFGVGTFFFCILYIFYALYRAFFTAETVSGWASLIVLLLSISAVQFIFLGILGEYIGKIFMSRVRTR